ncbi:MAG: hypothetical protein DRQ49_13805 [Gammaproteobacteria bacterium]|nr:MAG: hypothetical protein DRQ41_13085 [Gammaproteobacteria bacterium]RKZ38621.1 MAG: hypothetical protein DRQ49_13805 [Gammaproteobacteria bacterium]RKZ72694.1 MAG: hypothetical protein DRQ57_16615 [Gammaproteobacteria bacterium]
MTVRTPILPKVLRHHDSDTSRLKEVTSRLKTDVSRLRIEKAQLRTENVQLKTENVQLKEDKSFLYEELEEQKKISELKDIELADNTAQYQILEEERLRLYGF